MNCYVNRQVDYNNIAETLKLHTEFLSKTVMKIASLKIQKGLDFSEKREYGFHEVPGLAEAGFVEDDLKNEVDLRTMGLKEKCLKVMKKIVSESCSWPFRYPVDRTENPRYLKIIKYPMDLSIVKLKIEDEYTSFQDFTDDI